MAQELAQRMRAIRSAFEQGNIMELRQQSGNAISEAAYNSDKVLAEISLISYCLHKMSVKTHFTSHRRWAKVKETILHALDDAMEELEKNNLPGFEKQLGELSQRVVETDKELGNYAASIYETARVKMASNAYGLGLSLSQAAALTGAGKKQLLNYIGITKMHDETAEAKGINARLKQLKKVLEE